MIKKLLISLFAFLAISNFALSQLDIEGFKAKVANYTIVDSVSRMESTFSKTYASPDSTNIYEVNFNFEGEIINDEWWDIAITHRILDQRGREIEFSQYEKDGTLAIRDTPPIIETIYFDSISVKQTNYLNGDRGLESRMERSYDDQGREIEMRWYDKNFNLESKTTYDFDDENHTRTEKQYDAGIILKTSSCGVAIKVVKYPMSGFIENRTKWLEERFYDAEMKLVDCAHNYVYDKSFSIVQRTQLPGNKIRFVLLNAKSEIVKDEIVQLEEEEN